SSGDLLIVLDTVQLRSDVNQAKYNMNEVNARLEGARATLEQAKEEYDRQQRLFDKSLTSQTAYTDAKYKYLNAKSTEKATVAQAKQSQFRYEKVVDNLGKATIVAPMNGVVTFVDCEVGEIAPAQTGFSQGKTLMTVSDLSLFEVEVEVDETEINKVQLNQEVEIEVDAFPDTTFAGTVVEIGNTAVVSRAGTQDQATNFRVMVVFADSDVSVRPGMSATVDITTSRREEAVSVPFSAVVMRSFDMDSLMAAREQKESAGTTLVNEVNAAENGDLDKNKTEKKKDVERKDLRGVFVIKDGKARFVEIKTGIADQKFIEITSGLEPGDSVVAGPYKSLRKIKDGDALEVQKDEEDKE
ncbi:MAG: efflux RND transporter periplasmic adaptor subunit, partial [candidate division Zixibacteria bacterium]|nr:efflux RND transporter periplasmic adaptor subunit [candidate division Zixibacteria bacterium]